MPFIGLKVERYFVKWLDIGVPRQRCSRIHLVINLLITELGSQPDMVFEKNFRAASSLALRLC